MSKMLDKKKKKKKKGGGGEERERRGNDKDELTWHFLRRTDAQQNGAPFSFITTSCLSVKQFGKKKHLMLFSERGEF